MKHIEKIKITILSSFFLTFTFLVFGTLELYINNKEEFWFTYSNMILPIMILCILVFGICTLILLIIPNKFFKYGIAALFGFTLALYIQGNFLPNDYGVLDGTAINWDQYKGRLVYNSIIWCALFFSAFFLLKKNPKNFFGVSKILMSIVLITQIITLITICLISPQNEHNSILSTKGEFEISQKNNTFVFILDCFDSELFCELIDQDPLSIQTTFEDFTFYHNVAGGATRTKYAIPYIFTGTTNTENDSYKEYLKKSFDSSPLINELKKSKYDSRFYTISGYIDMQQTIAIDNIVNDTLQPTSALGLTKDFLKLTAFRYAPHVLKRYFWIYSGDFDRWKASAGEETAYVCDNDSVFYNELITDNLKCSNRDNVFKVYHLNGAHPPYSMNENCERIDYTDGSEQRQALGALKIVAEFIEQLKNLGVYDNSAIFVMADHGARGYDQNPLFMVKLRGEHQKFQQSDIPLSYKDFPDMLTAVITNQEIDIEKDYICSGKRYFYVGEDGNNKVNIIEYAIGEKAYDIACVHPTGNVFWGNTKQESFKYEIGKELSFSDDATANVYCKSGFSQNEVTHTWTEDNHAEMYFELEGKYDNLLLTFAYGVYAAPQRVKVYANGNCITEYVAYEDEQQSIVIPKEYIIDNILKLELEFPDASSPYERGESNDTRKLAFQMYSLCITSIGAK